LRLVTNLERDFRLDEVICELTIRHFSLDKIVFTITVKNYQP